MSKRTQLSNEGDVGTSNICLDESFQVQEVPTPKSKGIQQLEHNNLQFHNGSERFMKVCIFASFIIITSIVILQGINFLKIKDAQPNSSQTEIQQGLEKSELLQNYSLILPKIQKMENEVLKIENQLQQKQKQKSDQVRNQTVILSKIQKMEDEIEKIEAQFQQKQKQIEKLQKDLLKVDEKYQQINDNKNQNHNKQTQQRSVDKNLSNATITLNNTESKGSSVISIKFKLRQKMRGHIPQKPKSKDYYEFNISNEELLKKNINPFLDKNNLVLQGIKQSELERAIKLLEVVHNVNFKGEFVFDHYNFYSSPEAKALALSKVLQQEKDYYDKKYEINKYSKDQIGICVFVPSYNNAKSRLYLRNLDSIFQQEYQNYHVVYVNDASTDGTGDYVKFYMQENEIPSEKYVIINNEKNQGNIANSINAAFNYCKEGQIMIQLDGDDSLIGRQAFSLLNAVYRRDKVALTYGQFLQVNQDWNNLIALKTYSQTIPQKALKQGTFRSLRGFYTSHLKTMYVDVFRQIKDADFKDKQGNFLQTTYDVVLMTPAIELVGQRLKFITQFIYEYRFGTGNNDENPKKRYVFDEVMGKVPLKKLQSMPFADNPKTIHYP